MSKFAAFIQARLWTVVVIAVLVLGVWGLVSVNRSHQKALLATLADGAPAARDAAVLDLVKSGRLPDTLINTQNPDQDIASPANVRSLRIRKNAVASVNRLSAEGKITADEAFDTLFLVYKDVDLDVKAAAESGLAALGRKSDANLNAVVQRLSNGDPDIRTAAVDVSGLIGGVKAAAAVNAVLFDPAAQDSAILALQRIGAPSVPLVIAHLEDPATPDNLLFRQQMLATLDLIASPTSIPTLLKIAGQTAQPSVQRLAQVALASSVLAAYGSVTTAQKALADAKDAAAKMTASAALTKAEAEISLAQSAEPTLREILGNKASASESRSQAALALGRSGSPAARAALATGLSDLDAQVRTASAIGLQASGPAAVGPLTAALMSGDVPARTAAAQALGGIGTPAALSALTASFGNPATPDQVREGVIVGLGRSGSPSVIPVLVGALGDRDGAVTEAAQEALLTPALAKQAIPALVAALSGPTPVPFNAGETLARMGVLAETDVVPRLTAVIASGTAPTQTWAAITLGELGTKSTAARTALEGLSKSANPQVQYAASQSLLKLSGAS